MRRTHIVPSLLALSFAAVPGCTRTNPGFGPDSDGSGSGESSGTDATDPGTTLEPSGGASQSGTNSSTDPTGEDTTSGDVPACGNGLKEPDLGEQCDDGEANGPMGYCYEDCTKNVCGDGIPAPDLPCDDGPNGSETCTPDCHFRDCGDGMVQYPEECEPGMVQPENCTDECVLNVCGDMQILGMEECDDGDGDDGDECVSCRDAFCGDGHIRNDAEACDDGNDDDIECTPACAINVCGDGFLNPEEEQCDGNAIPGCKSLGMAGANPSCNPDSCQLQGCTNCGNGVPDEGELCEPGDLLSCVEDFDLEGDGDVTCSNNCEPNLTPCCVPAMQPCDPNGVECCEGFFCGDGVCAEG